MDSWLIKVRERDKPPIFDSRAVSYCQAKGAGKRRWRQRAQPGGQETKERKTIKGIAVSPTFIIEVAEVRGKCPVYKIGDKVVIEGPRINLDRTNNICIHALPSLLQYVAALREGVDPQKMGLSKDGKYAYIQCVDPGEPYTEGGTVIFRCYRTDREEEE